MFESVQKRAAAFARDGLRVRRLVGSCEKLLSERGEAAGVSLARTTLDLYRELDRRDQARFFAALLAEFSPDPKTVLAAAQGGEIGADEQGKGGVHERVLEELPSLTMGDP